MKNLQFPVTLMSIGLLTILLFAFQQPQAPIMNDFPTGDFEKEWKTIDSLERRGLPQSALKEVEKLYAKAKRENNPSQIIKTIVYRGKYESQLEEDGFVNALNKVEAEVKSAQTPTKEILHSMLGEMYSQYGDNNSYKFQNRTETLEFDNQDIRTWPLEQILKKADEHYRKSVDPATRNIAIENLDDITNGKQANDQDIRPTVYDFLAHRAIRFFVNERRYLDEPANKFHIDEESYFAKASEFAKISLTAEQSDSRKFAALQFFQELVKLNLESKNKSALIDADRHRLEFVHSNSILDIKGDLYEKALRDLWKNNESNPTSAEVAHQLAQYYFSKNNNFKPVPHWQKGDKTQEKINGKWNYKTAYEICQEAMQKHPNTIGGNMCNTLQVNVSRKNLKVQVEKTYLPNKPLLGFLEYRNFTDSHFKLLKLTEEEAHKINRLNWDEKIAFLNNQPVLNKWQKTLPDDGDFRQHSIEFPIPALGQGQYMLMTSDNAEFSDKLGGVFTNEFQVSNLAYVQTTGEELGKIQFVAMNRKTGQPEGGVKADFFKNDYRSRNRDVPKKVATVISNKDGLIKPNFNENGSFSIKLTKGKETLYSKNFYGNYPSSRNKQTRQRTHFFLDRAIYRPGQTIYFKALTVEYDGDKMPKILKNHPITITLKDVNHQNVADLQLTTNEYGTVNGTFVAPTDGLLGNMTLTTKNQSRHNFRIEEYKRPKFSVDFDKIEDSYKLGDQVMMVGNAKAYAGNSIDGAKVTYRVVRTAYFPYWNWRRWGWYNPWRSSQMEITNGTTKTDENGKFEIRFEAIPDRSISKETKPNFTYKVYADVVDITGETQSGNTFVNAGYVALDLTLAATDKVNLSEKNELTLTANNLNGAPQKTEAEIQIFKLNVPNTVFNKRYWQKPDRQLLDEKSFKKDYPQFTYANEDEQTGWKPGPAVISQKVSIEGETKVDLNTNKLTPGAYQITVKSSDKYGEPIELTSNFTAYKEGSKRPPLPTIIYVIGATEEKEPGEKTTFQYATSVNELHLYGKMANRNSTIKEGWNKLKPSRKITHEITEQDRGGMGYQTFAVKNNRFYQDRQQVKVPWNNKDLNIEYATFRDKLRPGDEEEWVIKITGNKKEKVGAEFVAAMYDASLDALAPNQWNFSPFPKYSNRFFWIADNFQVAKGQLWQKHWYEHPFNLKARSYRNLDWFNWNFGSGGWGHQRGGVFMDAAMESAPMAAPAGRGKKAKMRSIDGDGKADGRSLPTRNVGALSSNAAGVSTEEEDSNENPNENVKDVPVRTNLNETVFFFPNLMTNAEGDVMIKFTMNEALTKWKFLGFAHTPDLQTAVTEKLVQTQKELMVVPNPPRFFREGDKIEFTAKVSNLTENDMNGTAELQLFDAITDEPVDIPLGNKNASLNFSAKAGQSDRLAWTIEFPNGGVQAIKHRVVAKAGNFSDGEEAIVPVLTNRMLVTETLPLPVRGGESKTFVFEELASASLSQRDGGTLSHHGLTLEYTSNPAWYAVQALPYLMEYPHQCTEQIFSRFYANSLATHVANSSPKVKEIFDRWKNYEPDALKSNLSKNQELKTALLEETPWVLDAQSEEQQKQNIGLLFDLNRMSYETDQVLNQLAQRQADSGGWAWFPGGRPNWYITQYVVEGIGHLQRLGVRPMTKNQKYRGMMEKAIRYCDKEIVAQYAALERRVKAGKTTWDANHLSNMTVHYLYARSFFLTPEMSQVNRDNLWRDQQGVSMSKKAEKAFNYYHGQAEKYWIDKGLYEQGMIALALDRVQQSDQPADIVKSLKERALNHEELGMYWKYNSGYYWYQMPIETHSLMIEVFRDVANDNQAVDDLKVWLLKNKQTNNWKTTKATASAVYALMMSGDSWITESKPVKVSFPSASNSQFKKDVDDAQSGAEAGTGYFKVRWDGKDVSPTLASVKVENPNEVISWGSLYWQYFEQLDKIKTFEKTPLTLKKQLFKVELSDTGEKIKPVSKSDVKVGDKLKVRIELRVDRDMEYVHMKDMRASGFEPLNVLSSYKWQGGLGYYESTKDASTNFFFDFLPKGTYVFEYPLRVVHNGDFSNGVTTIQCMYAPEFTSHSEGKRFLISE